MKKQPVLSQYLLYLFGALLLGGFFLPRYYDMPYPKPLGPQFDPAVKRKFANDITSQQPEVVLVGDSILFVGVDNEKLSEQLGVKTYSAGLPGAGSAIWYLIIKNEILESTPVPKYIVVLFRDTKLTIPAQHTTGRYFDLLDEYAKRSEPLVAQLAFINQMNTAEKIAEQYLPIYGARWDIRSEIDSNVRYKAPAALLNCSAECADEALNSIFGKQDVGAAALSQAVEDIYSPEFMNFEKQNGKSFLPPMIQLAQENGITLIFVRTKSLTYPEYASEPPALRAYGNLLKAYLSRQDNVRYLDLSHDYRILAAYFSDEVHLNAKGREVFTQSLANELKAILK
ncbi:MAG: hypothetical protein PHQ36_05310 [Anaerolineales bacterium]|nr:hypothetical protein [Anaerolineales bacterium]